MAVFAGVFLSSLVITTVLAYGVGLSQVFFEGFLEINAFDAKVEFNKEPSDDNDGWSNNTTHLLEARDELVVMEDPRPIGCLLRDGTVAASDIRSAWGLGEEGGKEE